MKRNFLIGILAILTTGAAYGQALASAPALRLGACYSAALSAWIPIHAQVSTAIPYQPYPIIGLAGQNGTSYYPIQCDSSGNITPGGAAGGVLSGTYPSPGLSASPQAIPNGWTATTQSAGDNSTKVATTAYAQNPGAITPSSVTTSALTVNATANVGAPTSSGATAGGTAGVSSTNFLYASCIDNAGNTTAAVSVSANITTITANQTIPWVIVRPSGAVTCYGWPATSGTPAYYFSFGSGTTFSQSAAANTYTAAASYPAGGAFPASNTTGPATLGALAGGGKLPLCVDNNGKIYVGTNTVGVLACP